MEKPEVYDAVLDSEKGRRLLAESLAVTMKYWILIGDRKFWPKPCRDEERSAQRKLHNFIIKTSKEIK